ncbi:MAG: hypothetical protein FJ303_02465 [Planctomycetes bacterium]|nr:hypothetical protein [Planctomycetota bacterium]
MAYADDEDDDTLTIVAVNEDPEAVGNEIAAEHGHITVEADGSFVYILDSDGITTVTMTVTIHVG